MDITFRRINTPEGFTKVVEFLRQDVKSGGGSASEVINTHGTLRQLTVCQVPWGTLLINQEVSRLEAMAWFMQEPE